MRTSTCVAKSASWKG